MGQFTDSRYKGGMALKSNLPITAASQMLYWGGKGQEGKKKKKIGHSVCVAIISLLYSTIMQLLYEYVRA